MGLFGYNKRDFEKNTETFKSRLEEIMKSTDEISNLAKYGFYRSLADCKRMLDEFRYNENGKDYKTIDKEINNIFGNIEEALAKKNWCYASGHMELLRDEIDYSRRYGKNVFSDAERKAKWRKTVIFAKITEITDRKEAIANQEREIFQNASKSSVEEMEKYKSEYDALCSEKEILTEELKQCEELYKAQVSYMNAMENQKFFSDLDPVKLFGTKEYAVEEFIKNPEVFKYRALGLESLINLNEFEKELANAGKAPKREEIKCARCGTANDAGKQYCEKCGQALKK
jgi:hypothetical protein